jgi:hypothetical protein
MTNSAGTPEEIRRIAELRKKINDRDYVAFAIQRIAQVLSNELIERNEISHERTK